MLPRRKKLLILLSTVGIGACFFLPAEIGSPGRTFAQNAGDTKIAPLDLKPGLWEFHIHTSNTDVSYAASKASMVEITKNYTPEQRAKAMADYEVSENKAIADRKKGSDRKSNHCPLKQDFVSHIEAIGPNCPKQISSTGQEFNMHIACKNADGTPGYVQTNKFRRIDAENFQGTIEVASHVPAIGTVTETFAGKWISDSCSGPPAGYAAKNGLHPKGPENVARDDPNRIVAAFDGKQITAQQAWNMLKKVPPATRSSYKSGMTGLLERIYLQNAIAGEAIKLHLDKQQPWKDQLNKAKTNDLQHVQNYAGDPNIPPEVWARWVDDQQHILYHAYFSQGATKEENDALLKKEQAKYKITVKDPDFFSVAKSP
jgi:Protein of unknown function (DUF3617)